MAEATNFAKRRKKMSWFLYSVASVCSLDVVALSAHTIISAGNLALFYGMSFVPNMSFGLDTPSFMPPHPLPPSIAVAAVC